ncbi:MAG: GTP:adenosylcobinamide-phosphate guanylyltransferase [Pseudohongiellaceae bacterium]|jgi:GTP:adenosylcobinamide-phosphate guanylyltransferase
MTETSNSRSELNLGNASSLSEEGQVTVRPVYPHKLDAIVLAGTHRNPKRLIAGMNKAFLEIDDRPLVRHVVDALLAASHIDHIFVVGPIEQLSSALAHAPARVCPVQQQGKMLTNLWAGIYASESRHDDLSEEQVHQRPLLITSCDLPLISGRAINDFIDRSAEQDNDLENPVAMAVGLAEESGVNAFYPEGNDPGIIRPYVELGFGRMRLANIYVARPRNLAHQDFLQTGFAFRKAVDWRNVLLLGYNFLSQPGGWGAAWLTARLQLTLMLSGGKGWMYQKLRSGNTKSRVEKSVGDVLGGKIKLVTTPYGGLSLDVDDEEDYRILKQRYEEWMVIHNSTDESLS